jgi:hypothetical protein
VGALLGAAALGAASGAEEPEVRTEPAVPLDRLLRLPESLQRGAPEPRRGGLTRSEWEARFREARAELDAARQGLEEVQRELEAEAGGAGSWQVTAPGQKVSAENSPLSYRLSQEIRLRREEVEAGERRLQGLIVEANLAGVPEEWRP